ncbi:hypothetical protein BGZ65_002925 [Modicella reniformis]|uniref:polynucleotide adenylyltransferase n=1 Tax=Modicella reniformis TaxID=1440133 RepID=A0A9P6J059_9FUNG|nr:hypothetical protein BGZ65_002925 [Modicella reniformis]
MGNRKLYLSILFQCLLFEHAAQADPGDFIFVKVADFARCFDLVAVLSRSDNYSLSFPSDIHISKNELNEICGIKDLIQEFNDPTDMDAITLFPYDVEIDDHDDYDDEDIKIPNLSTSEVHDFLWTYAREVPLEYHDDIATIICYIRHNFWYHSGSGGSTVHLGSDDEAVTKYTKIHNEAKLERKREKELQQKAKRRIDHINSQMDCLQDDKISSEERDREVLSLSKRIQTDLNTSYPRNFITVQLLGSFANGLSSQTSDADLTALDTSNYLTIQTLAAVLKRRGYRNVVPIPNAKVPIVTFKDPRMNILCDMSINESVAIENSRLIKTYGAIDNRVRIIWFSLKQIAKRYGILSAKKGFLSSYALTLMLITYLQTVTPPILPDLQQQTTNRMVDRVINGHNCSFDRNWSNHEATARMNTDTPAELLLGLLKFFGYKFNYDQWEVNTRLGQFLTMQMSVDSWNMCVMDPFMVTRNVAGMVRESNVRVIKEAFQKSYTALMNEDWYTATNTSY